MTEDGNDGDGNGNVTNGRITKVADQNGCEGAAPCPLCLSERTSLCHEDRYRTYFSCQECGLVHVPKPFHLSPEDEKRRYDLHRNMSADAGYRAFLGKLADPITERVARGAEGLDFGSGPSPVLAEILGERGFKMAVFDCYYAADRMALGRRYDFVTCCEVVEHFSDPKKEWALLFELVTVGGWLGIMTQMLDDAVSFPKWHYINDETHVCFYSRKTFQWLGRRYGVDMTFPVKSVAMCRKL